MTRMLGSELEQVLDGYCARHGITRREFAAAAGLSPAIVLEVGRKAFPLRRLSNAIGAFIAAHPDGPGDVPVTLGGGEYGGATAVSNAKARSKRDPSIDAAYASARERAPARCIHPAYRARLRAASASETIATAFVETPADLIATVRRQWPDLWARVVDQSRAAGTLPGAMLAHVIERGLEAEA